MKSIKPGRGPSRMSFAGTIFVIIFGILWTVIAIFITRDAPIPIIGFVFPLFGVAFVAFGIVQAVYHYKNATSKERYSLFDIADSREEGDPAGRYYSDVHGETVNQDLHTTSPKRFCPYCGENLKGDYAFCPSCGRKL